MIINMKRSQMTELAAKADKISNELDDIANRINAVMNGLDMEVSSKENIKTHLSNCVKTARKEQEFFKGVNKCIVKSNEELFGEDKRLADVFRGALAFLPGVFGAAKTLNVKKIPNAISSNTSTDNAVTHNNQTSYVTNGGNHAVYGGTSKGSKEAAEKNGIKFYTQQTGNKYFSQDYFKNSDGKYYGDGYANVSCGVCCDAMILSYFGVDITPGELIERNINGKAKDAAFWDTDPMQQVWKEAGLSATHIGTGTFDLDKALELHFSNPDKVAPAFICAPNSANKNHYVLVTGKNSDGTYNIIDSGNYSHTIIDPSKEEIKGVWSFSKN